MAEGIGHTPEEVWSGQITAEVEARIIQGALRFAMMTGLTPGDAGQILEGLDSRSADLFASSFSGVGAGEIIRNVGKKLSRSSLDNPQT